MSTKNTPYYEFGKRLKELRKKAGYKTQQDFADNFKFPDQTIVSLQTVQSWEQGRQLPTSERQLYFCKVFNCNLDYLLGTIKEQTHDLQFVCDYTGLSGEAIENLRSERPGDFLFRTSTISHFFENDDICRQFFRDMQAVSNCYRYVRSELSQYGEEIQNAVAGYNEKDAERNLQKLLSGDSLVSLSSLRRSIDSALYAFSVTCAGIFLNEREELYEALSKREREVYKELGNIKQKGDGNDGEGHTQS